MAATHEIGQLDGSEQSSSTVWLEETPPINDRQTVREVGCAAIADGLEPADREILRENGKTVFFTSRDVTPQTEAA